MTQSNFDRIVAELKSTLHELGLEPTQAEAEELAVGLFLEEMKVKNLQEA